MPEGTPKTDEERKEAHKEKYGNENIPVKRKGLAFKALEENKRLVWVVRAVLVLLILWLLYHIVKYGRLKL